MFQLDDEAGRGLWARPRVLAQPLMDCLHIASKRSQQA